MKNLAIAITILASFVLVTTGCKTPSRKEENKQQNAHLTTPMTPAATMAAPAAAQPARSSMGAPSTPLPAAMSPTPTALPASRTVMAADPKGKALTLIEKACTDMESYTNHTNTGKRTFEIVCRNNENSFWHRMCYSSFPKIPPVRDDISSRSQIITHSVTAYFHTHMIVGGVKVNVNELDCFKVPTELVGKAPRQRLKRRRYRRTRGMNSGSGRNYGSGSGRSTVASNSGSSGGPTAHDREQNRKIAANSKGVKRNSERLDTNDERWAARNKWAKIANTLLNSLKKK